MQYKRIAIGCDHAGFIYKRQIIKMLKDMDIEVHDWGAFSKESVDYPDFVHPVAKEVANRKSELGVLLCGSGNGVAMTANKHQKIRAAVCWNEELASLARQHNDANIIAIPSRFVSEDMALKMVRTFLETSFEGGRHESRVSKISLS